MIATIVFGNGIGMALAPDYFKLSTGLEFAWNTFSPDDKRLISLGSDIMPLSENELERHHLIMTACQELTKHENDSLQWLADNGKKFPNLYQNFIYKVAKYFFDYDGKLPDEFDNFIGSLCQFIKNLDRCHIATLNYDKLLYGSLIQKDILKGYQDHGLVDGICDSGFQPEKLLRTITNFGWYLHLHGSPIFQTNGNEITKCNLNLLPSEALDGNVLHNHIVLAKTELKPEIISNSTLLGTYFTFFANALSESDALYVVGYSGDDKHINFEIKSWILNKINKNCIPLINIIEWEGSPHNDSFWRQRFMPENISTATPNRTVTFHLQHMENILKYQFLNP